MFETASAIKDEMFNILNPSAFSVDSIEGWIIMLVGLILVRGFWQKSVKAVWWAIGAIFFSQAMYALSLTGFNDIIPVGYVFKYDVATSLAQCFVGTKVCDVILWFDSIIMATMSGLWNSCGDIINAIINNAGNLSDPFPHATL